MLYKIRYYRSGRGYIYRANQMISIVVGLNVCLAAMLVSHFRLGKFNMFLLFLGCAFSLFYLLERNVTKEKLFAHRETYIKRHKCLYPFYIFVAIELVLFLIFYYRAK